MPELPSAPALNAPLWVIFCHLILSRMLNSSAPQSSSSASTFSPSLISSPSKRNTRPTHYPTSFATSPFYPFPPSIYPPFSRTWSRYIGLGTGHRTSDILPRIPAGVTTDLFRGLHEWPNTIFLCRIFCLRPSLSPSTFTPFSSFPPLQLLASILSSLLPLLPPPRPRASILFLPPLLSTSIVIRRASGSADSAERINRLCRWYEEREGGREPSSSSPIGAVQLTSNVLLPSSRTFLPFFLLCFRRIEDGRIRDSLGYRFTVINVDGGVEFARYPGPGPV